MVPEIKQIISRDNLLFLFQAYKVFRELYAIKFPSSLFFFYKPLHFLLSPTPSQASAIRELPDVQAGFRKGRGTRHQIANIHWIIEKAREFQKTSNSSLLTMPRPLTMWITINCGKF